MNSRFKPADALVYTLIFNTTPVAFGALGIPVTTLATLTGLDVRALSAMMGRQMPIASLFLPAYALLFYAGPRAGLLECWPAALIAGLPFATFQAIFANLVGPELPDLMAGLASLVSVILFVQFWKPPYRLEYEANVDFLLDDSQDINNAQDNNVNSVEMQERSNSDATDTCEKIMPNINTASTTSTANTSSINNVSGKALVQSGSSVSDTSGNTSPQEKGTSDHIETADSERLNSTGPTISPRLEKLTWKETFLVWSPWSIIIIVVIM